MYFCVITISSCLAKARLSNAYICSVSQLCSEWFRAAFIVILVQIVQLINTDSFSPLMLRHHSALWWQTACSEQQIKVVNEPLDLGMGANYLTVSSVPNPSTGVQSCGALPSEWNSWILVQVSTPETNSNMYTCCKVFCQFPTKVKKYNIKIGWQLGKVKELFQY